MRNSLLYPFLSLIVLLSVSAAAQPTVTSVSPARHDFDASPTSDVVAGFSTNMANPAASAFRVRSNLRGYLAGSFSGSGSSKLTFDPSSDLLPGEEIEVVLTTGITDSQSTPMAAPHVWRYQAAAGTGPLRFDAAVSSLASGNSWDCAFGDVDGDGDMDLVVGNFVGQNVIWINDGSGNFSSKSFGPNDSPTYAVALADMDDDGDLDIVTGEWGRNAAAQGYSGQNEIWFNDGSGGFPTHNSFGDPYGSCMSIALGDLDGDGDVDIVEGNGGVGDEANSIYLNDGNGNLTRRGFLMVPGYTFEITDNTWAIRLGDADNDGDLDVFTGNFGLGTTVESYVYFNDGAANFYGGARTNIGSPSSVLCMCVADLDHDGDVDVACGTNANLASYIYWNNGATFTSSTMIAPSSDPAVWSLAAGDVDGDGDADLGIGYESWTSKIVTNNGSGTFTSNYYLGGSGPAYGMAFADVDGDGDVDAAMPSRVCTNGSNRPKIAVASNGTPVTNGGTINVAYNDTVASLGLQIDVTDKDGDYASLAAQITNLTGQGIAISEFSKSVSATPYAVNPTTGAFNQGSVTHTVTLTATDIGESSTFVFDIVVAAAPNNAPALALTANGAAITNGGTLNVAWGTTLASLGLVINVTDPDGDAVAVAGTVSNASGTGILNAEFSSAAKATGYVLTPGTGTFSQGSTTHVVSLAADDGRGGTAAFSFSVAVGAMPSPTIELFETTVGGVAIANGSGANSLRDFGSQLVGAGPTAALTVVIHNSGNADLTLGGISLSGADAGEFVLDLNGTASVVSAGASTSFAIQFDPNTAGTKGATVEVVHDDGKTATPFTFAVAGVGTTPAPAPIIVVKEGSLLIANGMGASAGRNFGGRSQGDVSAPLTITIENAGNADLSLGTPTLTGAGASDFSISAGSFPVVLGAGQSATFTVTYLAMTVGVQGAAVEITHNDSSTTTPFTFGVVGTAVANNGGGNSGGSGDSSGGGCAAGGDTLAAILLLMMLGGLAVARRRKVSA